MTVPSPMGCVMNTRSGVFAQCSLRRHETQNRTRREAVVSGAEDEKAALGAIES